MVPPDQDVSQSRGAVLGWLVTSRGGPLSRISGGGNLTLRTWEWLSPCLVPINFSLRAPDRLAASYFLSR